MDYLRLESELRKRTAYPYRWGIKQADACDRRTKFIYHIFSFRKLLATVEQEFAGDPKYQFWFNYTLNRWYNFWSAKGVEDIFCHNPLVHKNPNPYDRLADFTIGNIPFDHKTTRYPRSFKRSLEYAQANPLELIEWLYANQSQQGRKHFKNRLFIVLFNQGEKQAHWKLKAEIAWLKSIIESYLNQYDPRKLFELVFKDDTVYSDIIWAVKN